MGVIKILRNLPISLAFFKYYTSFFIIIYVCFGLWATVNSFEHEDVVDVTDVLRDSVIWGYAVFSIVIFVIAIRSSLNPLIKTYSSKMKYLPIWGIIGFAIPTLFPDVFRGLLWVPDNQVAFHVKPGDLACHLAASLLFYKLFGEKLNPLLILLWICAAALLALTSRASMLVLAFGIIFGVLLRPKSKILATIVSISVLSLIFLYASGIEFAIRSGRLISFQSVIDNIISIFSEVDDDSKSGTKRWRLLWWNDIIHYTVFGEYFWFGKGYGINLSVDDGYLVGTDTSLRSPHSIHFNILARGGVLAAGAWILLNISFLIEMLISIYIFKKYQQTSLIRVCYWVLGYWLFFQVNASFDVFLEGPNGGIWFWTVIGIGVYLIHKSKQIKPTSSQSLPMASQQLIHK